MTKINNSEFRYKAFISYRHVDRNWARWLMQKLESYRVPRSLIKRGYSERIGILFRDDDEMLASSNLSLHIEKALRNSEFLIVVCSKDTPESQWVRREISYFRELGRGNNILSLLVNGDPTESFPPELRVIETEGPNVDDESNITARAVEPIAADVRPHLDENSRQTKKRAFLQIAAALINCDYSDLTQRHKERERRRWQAIFATIIISLSLVGLYTGYQWKKTEVQRNVAITNSMVSEALTIASSPKKNNSQLDKALLLAAQATQRSDDINILGKAIDVLQNINPYQQKYLQADNNQTNEGRITYSRSATFHPNNKLVIGGGLSGRIRLWKFGEELPEFNEYKLLTETVSRLAVSPSGKILAIGDIKGNLTFFDISNRKLLEESLHVADYISCLAISPGGQILVAGGGDALTFWDLETQTQIGKAIKFDKSEFREAIPSIGHPCAFSPDGKTLAIGIDANQIRLFDVATRQILSNIILAVTPISLDFSNNGNLLFVGGINGDLFKINIGKERKLKFEGGVVFGKHKQMIIDLKHHPSRKLFASASLDGIIYFWDSSTLEKLGDPLIVGGRLSEINFSSDGSKLVSAGNYHLTIWNTPISPTVGHSFKAHSTSIFHADFVRNGNELYTQSSDEEIKRWDTSKNAVKPLPVPFSKDITDKSIGWSVNKSGDTAAVITNMHSKTGHELSPQVQIWDINSSSPLGSPFAAGASAVILFSNGKKLLTYHNSGELRLWDTFSQNIIGQPIPIKKPDYFSTISNIALSPDNSLLAIGYPENNEIHIWQLHDRTLQRILKPGENSGSITKIIFSNDSKKLAIGTFTGKLYIWDLVLPDDKPSTDNLSSIHNRNPVSSLNILTEQNVLIVGYFDGIIKILDISDLNFNLINPISPAMNKRDMAQFDISTDGKKLAVSNSKGFVNLWDLDQIINYHKPLRFGKTLSGFTSQIMSIAFSDDGRYFAYGDLNGVIQIWDTITQKEAINSFKIKSAPLKLNFLDNDHLASLTWNGFQLWELANGSKTNVDNYSFEYLNPGMSSKAKLIVHGNQGTSGELLIYNPIAKKKVGSIIDDKRLTNILNISISPDGTLMATNDGSRLYLWDLKNQQYTGKSLMLPNRAGLFTNDILVFSQDATTIAIAQKDSKYNNKSLVMLWDISKDYSNGSIIPDTYNVSSLAFSPDGRLLATGHGDGLIRLWDRQKRTKIAQPLKGHNRIVTHIKFSPDGKTLASGGGDRTVVLWNLDLQAVACNIAGRNLNKEEWERYIGDDSYEKTCPQYPVPSISTEFTPIRYDPKGNITEKIFFSHFGPSTTEDGIAGWKRQYDSKGNITEETYIDMERNPTLHKTLGYATWKAKYDENGVMKTKLFFDENLKPLKTFTVIDIIHPENQAAKLGLKAHDILVSYAGHPVNFIGQFKELVQKRKQEYSQLVISRNGEQRSFNIAPGEIGMTIRDISEDVYLKVLN